MSCASQSNGSAGAGLPEKALSSPSKSFSAESSFLKSLSSQQHTRICMSWENINLSVAIKDSKQSTFFNPKYKIKKILQGVTGKAVSGELLAIMGPTGQCNVCFQSLMNR
jgi:hypothetical protein